jgi:fatty-acyl-CoA synthase
MTADTEELRRFCQAQLSAHKAPSHWIFVDQLPVTPTGKTQKFLLRQQLASGELADVMLVGSATNE